MLPRLYNHTALALTLYSPRTRPRPRTQLFSDVVRILPRNTHILGMTPPRHNLILIVQKLDRGVSKCFAELITSDFRSDRVADFAAGVEISNYGGSSVLYRGGLRYTEKPAERTQDSRYHSDPC